MKPSKTGKTDGQLNQGDAYMLFCVIATLFRSAEQAPKLFTLREKLMFAHNQRTLLPHAKEYETMNDQLVKEHGEKVKPKPEDAPDAPEQFTVAATSKKWPEFKKAIDALNSEPVILGSALRTVQEKDLGAFDYTPSQLDVLRKMGVLHLTS